MGGSNKNRKRSVRNGKIDLLRFLFSVTVAIFHFNKSVEYPNEIFNSAYIAVEFFFIVSGYLMCKSMSSFDKQKNVNVLSESYKFIKRKYLSFFYYHIFVVVATVIIWIPYFQLTYDEWRIKVLAAIPDIFLLQMFGFRSADWLFAEWYLSAMIISMFILAPIMIKYRQLYSRYIAPVLSMILINAAFKHFSSFDITTRWQGFFCVGMFRAFGEISLGCVAYSIVESKKLERLNRTLLILVELLCYIEIFRYMYGVRISELEPAIVLMLVPAVMISFSSKASLKYLNNRAVYFLGKLSLPIYLCHSIARYLTTGNGWTPGSYAVHVLLFLAFTLALSLVCLFTVDGIKHLCKKKLNRTEGTVQ